MAEQLTQVSGNELVEKILVGERDFSGIRCEGFDLAGHERFKELNQYLKDQDLKENPVIITGSSLVRIHAPRLYLLNVKGEGAYLAGANLTKADLARAYLAGADLARAYLAEANLAGADLTRANLAEANLARARNIEKTIGLERALFYKTKISKKDQETIQKAIDSVPRFEVVE